MCNNLSKILCPEKHIYLLIDNNAAFYTMNCSFSAKLLMFAFG